MAPEVSGMGDGYAGPGYRLPSGAQAVAQDVAVVFVLVMWPQDLPPSAISLSS